MLRPTIGMIAVVMLAGVAEAAPLTVQVEGAGPGQGPVLIGICSGSLDFGSCRYSQNVQPPAAEFQVVFPDVPEGSYAIAVFQDTNGNTNLDRDPRGLPLEPYGFSNGTGRTAPPSFEAARIRVAGPTLTKVRIARSPLAR
ncbi:DUF2141 domain-containing protein [Microvirga sp. BSC39]|uniref:DUF2141 domain-containing protein n=1 Tax=Microvirga sp. BSC39 TaxID=1549810 RepID=UPI0004E93E20|nr:DUF2141 domain-containing protein [Microvirga sp. BSC39]KFG68548.1 hypothetical protein JH26_16405 [Microvirga sp. BSC39]